MTNLHSTFNSRDISLPTKVCLVKAMVFPVVMYECESWTVKKAERQRIDAFELWCWRRLLSISWTARRSNQSILKKISPGCSLEGLMLKLKLQYSGYLMQNLKRHWCWERLKAGGEGDNRGWDGWMASLIQWTWVCASCERWWWTGRPGMLRSMGSQRAGHDWATELNWVLKNPPTNCRRHGRSWFDSWVRKVPWRRKGPPTPVFLLGESHGQRSPAGYSLWGHKGSDVTKCMRVCVHIDTIISPKWVWICSLNMGETEN